MKLNIIILCGVEWENSRSLKWKFHKRWRQRTSYNLFPSIVSLTVTLTLANSWNLHERCKNVLKVFEFAEKRLLARKMELTRIDVRHFHGLLPYKNGSKSRRKFTKLIVLLIVLLMPLTCDGEEKIVRVDPLGNIEKLIVQLSFLIFHFYHKFTQ